MQKNTYCKKRKRKEEDERIHNQIQKNNDFPLLWSTCVYGCNESETDLEFGTETLNFASEHKFYLCV
jgi:hypothetical protein